MTDLRDAVWGALQRATKEPGQGTTLERLAADVASALSLAEPPIAEVRELLAEWQARGSVSRRDDSFAIVVGWHATPSVSGIRINPAHSTLPLVKSS